MAQLPLVLHTDEGKLYVARYVPMAPITDASHLSADQRIYLENPYSPDGVLSSIPSAGDWVPFRCVRDSESLRVQFIGLDGRPPIEWELSTTGAFLGQEVVDRSLVLDWLTGCSCLDSAHCRHTALDLHPPESVLSAAIYRSLGATEPTTASQKYAKLRLYHPGRPVEELLCDWLAWVASRPESLIRVSLQDLPATKGRKDREDDSEVSATDIYSCARSEARSFLDDLAFYESLHPDLQSRYLTSNAEHLASVATGFVAIDSPLTGRTLITARSEVLTGPPFPFVSHCLLDDHETFFEIQGGGWIADTKCFVLPALGALLEIARGDSWGSPADPAVIRQLCANWGRALADPTSLAQIRADSRGPIRVLVPEIENLGHMIWNVASGVALLNEFLEGCHEETESSIAVEAEMWRTAARLDYVAPFFSQVKVQDLAGQFQVRDRRDDALTELGDYHGLTVMLLAGCVHDRVIEGIANSSILHRPSDLEFEGRDAFHVYINLRAHDKRCLNLSSSLPQALSPCAKAMTMPMVVHIEVMDDGVAEAMALQRALDRVSIESRIYSNLDLSDLVALVGEAAIAVAPIGSGLVIPTWIFGKPTVLHGNLGHQGQAAWWATISSALTVDELFLIGPDDTFQSESALYADYEIRGSALDSNLMKALLSSGLRLGEDGRDRK
jgi:hypothetical protein